VQHSTVVYVVECSFRTKDKSRTCNARTSTRLKKLWVSSHFWNSGSLRTPSPPLPTCWQERGLRLRVMFF